MNAGKSDKTKSPPPGYYLRRFLFGSPKHNNWSNIPWDGIVVKSFAEAEAKINEWNLAKGQWEFRLPLHCQRCYIGCVETFPSLGLGADLIGIQVCGKCHAEGLQNMKKPKPKPILMMPTPTILPKVEHKQGDVWKLPKGNSPLWTEQWAYQGSAKSPYIVSRKQDHKFDGSTDESWACSCMNWTRNTPRVDCKHILQIKLKEKVQAAPQKIAGLSNDQQAAFEKWQREQAEKGVTIGNIPEGADFTPKGRKFR